MNNDQPTELTIEDIDNFVKNLKENSEIKTETCIKCSKSYFNSYGYHKNECDQCYFSRFPKEEVKEFCRSFLE